MSSLAPAPRIRRPAHGLGGSLGLMVVLMAPRPILSADVPTSALPPSQFTVLLAVDPGYDISSFTVSPDGKRFAARAQRGKQWFVIVDGKTSPAYEWCLKAEFSADSKRVLYVAKRGGKWRLVVDGQEDPQEWDELYGARFSSLGDQLSYAGTKDGRYHRIEDGREVASGDPPILRTRSADGKHEAFVVKRGNQSVLVVDGVAGPGWDEVTQLSLSADGRRVAYAARRGKEVRVIVDGQEGEPFQAVGGLVFSPDGKRFGYKATPIPERDYEFESKESLEELAKGARAYRFGVALAGQQRYWILVLDGRLVGVNLVVGGPVFSPVGGQLLYTIGDHKKSVLYIDGRKVGEIAGDGGGALFVEELGFSPGADRLWLGLVKADRGFLRRRHWFRVYDAAFDAEGAWRLENPQDGPAVEGGGGENPVFGPDGRHYAYAHSLPVSLRKRQWRIVVDGHPGELFESIEPSSIQVTPGSVTFLAFRGNSLLSVTQPFPAH